jgi:hypothetical protein
MTISVTDLHASGVSLVPYASSDYTSLAAAAVSPSVAAAIQPLLLYSAFVANKTALPILACTVSWAMVDKTGTPFTNYQTFFDPISLAPAVLPDGAILATVMGSINTPGVEKNQQILNELAAQASLLQSQASVTISLEAVMFVDGSTIGRDTSLSMAQTRARMRSEYDLYTAVLQKATDTPTDSAFISWLQALANALPPGAKLSFSMDPFPTWYKFYQARLARELVNFASQRTVQEMVAFVQKAFVTKQYPPLVIN